MNKIIIILIVIALAVGLIFSEGIPNIIYHQYEKDCKEGEKFYVQSFITSVGYCVRDYNEDFCNQVKRCEK